MLLVESFLQLPGPAGPMPRKGTRFHDHRIDRLSRTNVLLNAPPAWAKTHRTITRKSTRRQSPWLPATAHQLSENRGKISFGPRRPLLLDVCLQRFIGYCPSRALSRRSERQCPDK